jgi:hypothetical protein
MRKNVSPQPIFTGDQPPNMENLIRANDNMWVLPEGKITFLEPQSQIYQFAMQEEERLRQLILIGCRVVELAQEKYLSGDAMQFKIAPELNLVSETRVELGDKALVNTIQMMCRVIVGINGRRTETDEEITEEIVSLGLDIEIPNSCEIEISLAWPDVFLETAQTRNLDMQTAIMATKADSPGSEPLFSDYSTRKDMARLLNVTDMTAEQLQIQKETTRKMIRKGVEMMMDVAARNGDQATLAKIIQRFALLLESNEENPFLDLFEEYTEKDPDDVGGIHKSVTDEPIGEQDAGEALQSTETDNG